MRLRWKREFQAERSTWGGRGSQWREARDGLRSVWLKAEREREMKHGGDTEVVGTGHGKHMDFVVGERGAVGGLEAGE